MKDQIKILDVVALTENISSSGLVSGQVGTIVEELAPDIYEVEFVDNAGRTYALLPLKKSQFILLHYEPVAG